MVSCPLQLNLVIYTPLLSLPIGRVINRYEALTFPLNCPACEHPYRICSSAGGYEIMWTLFSEGILRIFEERNKGSMSVGYSLGVMLDVYVTQSSEIFHPLSVRWVCEKINAFFFSIGVIYGLSIGPSCGRRVNIWIRSPPESFRGLQSWRECSKLRRKPLTANPGPQFRNLK